MDQTKTHTRVRVVVATSVMLSFISFWRAAAIVLNDLGSSAFYVGGIAESAFGKSAPWFILGVMLLSAAVSALYIESSSMFTRGGVYRVVKEAMGPTMAKLSVSALLFDFSLTGPISGTTAGLYLVGFVNTVLPRLGLDVQLPANLTAMLFAVTVTLYFWRRNIKGIHESSDDAMRIMYIVTVMVVIMILWSTITLIERGGQWPPFPGRESLEFSRQALGWLAPWRWFEPDATGAIHRISAEAPKFIAAIGIMVALGHSVLAMSGQETLAQINRELEAPKLKNLKRAALVIFVFSLVFTSLVSFFAVAIIPDETRPQYLNNLISGLALNLVGPTYLKVLFQAFVVIVGFLMLSGAVNTAIIGSNGVLNRISEDGVLTDWFRRPHKRYGTTYRIVTLIVALQLFTIIAARGDLFVLGEAYAFGVVWSFTFNAFATLILRLKRKEGREWKVPFNLRFGKREIPLGLITVALMLLSIATVNLLTKQVATGAGITLTVLFFTLFKVSEYVNQRKLDLTSAKLDQFQLQHQETVSQDSLRIRPGGILVAVRDYNTLHHLGEVLARTATEERDIVVMTTRLVAGPSAGEVDLYDENPFSEYEQRLFTRVVALAEKAGKPVDLLVVPSANVFDAIVQTAVRLDVSEIVAGRSAKLNPDEQARMLGKSWEQLREFPRREVRFTVVDPSGPEHAVFLGAHAPRLTESDISLIHKLWLQVSNVPSRRKVHHRDVVRVALIRLDRDLRAQGDVMLDFYRLEHEDEQGNGRNTKSGRRQ